MAYLTDEQERLIAERVANEPKHPCHVDHTEDCGV